MLNRCEGATWTGTTKELLDALEEHVDDRTKGRKGWPDSVAKVAAQLRRLAPVLRQNGYDVEWLERTNRSRPVKLRRTCESAQKTVTTVTPSRDELENLPW
jgi:hypothetical protein